MNKYIIRNCPAFVLMRTATSGTYFDMCGNAKGHIKCQDCTDCVMKQIVEMCKYYKKHNDCARECPSFGGFLNKLLNKLDIQEIK